jgi:3-hydroxyacyl-CoA dehydrogenase
MPITTLRDGNVLIVTCDNPRVNALGHAVRAGLAAALAEAAADPAVAAIVIACAGRTFFAGADITEFGKPPLSPSLPEVVNAIERSPKPVIAAVHGTALGGGLEIALGCHYRLAVPSAKLGLPEVKLGLLPGAGGTQRLPRVVGVPEALSIIVSGSPISAGRAAEIGLVDQIVAEGGLEREAIAFAGTVAGHANHPVASERDDRLQEARRDRALFDRFIEQQGKKIRGLDAPAACIRAIRAAVELPFADGVRLERQLFLDLMAGTQSKALRHVFFAERAAARIDELPAGTEALPIGKVGVVGAGTMGSGIATAFLMAGLPVTLVETSAEALDRGTGTIRKNLDSAVKRGRLAPEAPAQLLARLSPTLAFDALDDCDLAIEAVFENMDIKQEVFRKLDAALKPGAILATNTSYLDVDAIAAATTRPDRVVGLHFFSPAHIMKLLEVVRGARTAPPVLATAMAAAKKLGKTAVVSRVCHGFIGNRMLIQQRKQAEALALEGARISDVDRTLVEFGLPMGAFQMIDLAGVDVGWHRDPSRVETIREALCAAGRWGQKTGKGFYDYDVSGNRTESPEVQAIIADFAKRRDVPQRDIGPDEMLERQLLPMVNEGAWILAEGIAQRASDIDVAWINGYGWPIQTGGPMFWADTIGLDRVVEKLRAHADRFGPGFRLSPLLIEKAAAGQRLTA